MRVVVIAVLTSLVVGCVAEGICEDGPPMPSEGEVLASRCVSASAGGTIEMEGGVRLEIPPGALAEDTRLTVRTAPWDEPRPHRRIVLEPDGTVFSYPVRLEIPVPADASILAYHVSDLNEPSDVGLETSYYERLPIASDDEQSVTYELEHFSFLQLFLNVQETGYLVFDIPPRYLRPGDLLFALTDSFDLGPSWAPGHVGMFDGHRTMTGGAFERLVESTPGAGVRYERFERFIDQTRDGHLYLGAQRNPIYEMSDPERMVAVAFAEGQIGSGYSPVTFATPFGTRWSCSELVEEALDRADRGLANPLDEAVFSTPNDLFERSVPVDFVTGRVGEEMAIPMYAAVVDAETGTSWTREFTGHYQRTQGYAITIPPESLPPGATFEGSAATGFTLRWTPQAPRDVGRPYVIPVTLTYSFASLNRMETFTVDRELTLFGQGERRTITLEPSAGNLGWIENFAVPDGEEVRGIHVIVEETGEPVPASPFPGYAFEVLSVEQTPGNVRVELELRHEQPDVPPGDPFDIAVAVDFDEPSFWPNDGT